MPIINNPFNGKLNLDVAQYRISDGDYIDALNITKDSQGVGNDMVVANILGNTQIAYTTPDLGENKIIGFYATSVELSVQKQVIAFSLEMGQCLWHN